MEKVFSAGNFSFSKTGENYTSITSITFLESVPLGKNENDLINEFKNNSLTTFEKFIEENKIEKCQDYKEQLFSHLDRTISKCKNLIK
jgi:hypothetical protein